MEEEEEEEAEVEVEEEEEEGEEKQQERWMNKERYIQYFSITVTLLNWQT